MFQRVVSIAAVAGVLVGVGVTPAGAQSDSTAATGAEDIDDRVAQWLFERGTVLYAGGDYGNAKKLFIESLERSPNGPRAVDALSMLRASNEKLGIETLDDGRPADPSKPIDPYEGAPDGAPVDPYAEGEVPVDPYAQETPVDPYADGPADGQGEGVAGGSGAPVPGDGTPERAAHRALMAWGGAYGFAAGLALAGPEGADGEIGAGPIVLGALGAGAGVGLTHLLFRRNPMTGGQVAATISAGTWGAYTIGLMTDVFGVDSTDTNDVYTGLAIGGLIGFGGGTLLALRLEPSEGDVSFVNSLGMVGSSMGLLLGVAIDPPTGEAYSLQGALGATVGLVSGLWLSQYVETSRRRMLFVDLGAAAGAAVPWVLLYPLIADGSTDNDEQAAGLISTFTLAGGAIAAWILTRGSGRASDDASPAVAAPPALIRREGSGLWSLGAPLVRPMTGQSPLAPAAGGMYLGLDVVAGRF